MHKIELSLQRSVPSGPNAEPSLDALIISDLHLGSVLCQAKPLVELLERILQRQLVTKELVLNGDVFDSIDFRRLRKNHWKVLSLLRKLSDRISITWVCGNHDGPAEVVSHLLGVRVKDEHVIVSGSRAILVMHGHTFDDFLDAHPRITWIADVIYHLLQKIDPSHQLPKKAKVSSKLFLRCVQKIRERAIRYAGHRGFQAVCCGHTHHEEVDESQPVYYYNGGCWTEVPGTYLTIGGGVISLYRFVPTPKSEAAIDIPEDQVIPLQPISLN